MGDNFYYSRKERLSQASSTTKKAYEKRNQKGFFKKNPQLRILLIDLVIVLLFAVVIIPFFVRITKDIRVDDYKISPKAVLFEDKILVSIKVSNLYKTIYNRKTKESLKVEILKNSSIIESKEELFPTDDGEEKYISFSFNKSELDSDFVFIDFTSGDFHDDRKVLIEQ